MLCVHSSYGSLRQLALDSLGNIAEKVSTFYKGCKSWTWFITICYSNLYIWGLYNLFCFCFMKMFHNNEDETLSRVIFMIWFCSVRDISCRVFLFATVCDDNRWSLTFGAAASKALLVIRWQVWSSERYGIL